MFKYAFGGGGGSSETQPHSFTFSNPSSSSTSFSSYVTASNTGSDGRSGPFFSYGSDGRSGFNPLVTSVTVDPPSLCSATSSFSASSLCPCQNQTPPKSSKFKTRKKAPKPASSLDERVFMNALLSKSPGKEEGTSVDPQNKNKIEDRAEDHRMEKTRLESVIRNLKAQALREQDTMLTEVADKEKELPQLENELANLAIQPLEP